MLRPLIITLMIGWTPLAAAPSLARPFQTAPAADAAIDGILAVTLPTDRVVADALASFEQQFTEAFVRKTGSQLETRYPGVTKAIVADARTQVEPLFRGALIRQMRGALAGYYRQTFTAPELRQLADFYATPTGRKLVANVQKAGTEAAMTRPAKSVGDLSPALDNVMAQGMANAVQGMSPEDMAVLAKFSATSASRKANDSLPQLRQLTLTTMNDFFRTSQPRMSEIALAVVQRQIARLQAAEHGKQD
jgi:hypothetical protein